MKIYIVFLLILVSCANPVEQGARSNKTSKKEKRKAELKETCVCYEIYAPVCANGKTYANDCFARCDGVRKFKNGACSI